MEEYPVSDLSQPAPSGLSASSSVEFLSSCFDEQILQLDENDVW